MATVSLIIDCETGTLQVTAGMTTEKTSSEVVTDTGSSSDASKSAVNKCDPQNWLLCYKVYVLFVYVLLTMVTTYTSGAYAPGIPSMRKDFHVSAIVAQLGTCLLYTSDAADE